MGAPKYIAALDWGAIVPVLGLVFAKQSDTSMKKKLAIVFVHIAAIMSACAGYVYNIRILTIASISVAVAAWAYTLFEINRSNFNYSSLKIVEFFSPTSYLIAYPLLCTPTGKLDRFVGAFILICHILTVPMILILIWSKELHDAWGCYGSQRKLADYDKGMCGQWNTDMIQICRDLQQQSPPNVDCSSETTPFEFFGSLLHRIVQLQLISLTAWSRFMMLQYLKVSTSNSNAKQE